MKTVLAAVLLLIGFSLQASECRKVQENSIKNLKIAYRGTPKSIFQCNDKTGRHVFIASTYVSGKFDEPSYKSEIYFYKFTQDNTGGYITHWEARDFASSLVTIDLHSFEVLDVDQDNEVESFAFYSLTPDGLDSDTVKLLINYKNSKYAVRGELAKQPESLDIRTTDAMFRQLPKSVRQYVYKTWDRLF